MVKLSETESSTLEYKREIDTDDIRKTVVAFANTRGGTLKIGVEDDGTVIGIDQPNKDRITQIIRDGVMPKIIPKINIETYEYKDIIVVDIQDCTNIPYNTNNGIYYIRVEATTRIASTFELIDLLVDGPYSEAIVVKTRLPETPH